MIRIIVIVVGVSVCGFWVWSCHEASVKAPTKQFYVGPQNSTGWKP